MDPRGKKILRAIALVIALALVSGVLLFANALVGNPISRALAKRSAEAYLEENFPNADHFIQEIDYNFKDMDYYARVGSPSSADSAFTIALTMSGKYKYDNYQQCVAGRQNTLRRLDDAYRARCRSILEGQGFPYRGSMTTGFGTISDAAFFAEQDPPEPGTPMNTFDISALELDGVYPIDELGEKYGRLCLYIESDDPTAEKAAEILLTTKALMEAGEAPFFTIDLSLSPVRSKEGRDMAGEGLEILNFPWSAIYEEGLAERVQVAADETEAHYAQMDAQEK